jgi:hypothetical protein
MIPPEKQAEFSLSLVELVGTMRAHEVPKAP